MKREPTIRLVNLAIGYTSRHSVKTVCADITETIFSGELTCLIGENGATSRCMCTRRRNWPRSSAWC